jgi:hypothetical protein
MTKIKNKTAYPLDIQVSDTDYVIGSDDETSNKETKNYQMIDIKNYVLSGASPEVGGNLRVTEVNYNGVLTTPEAVANALNPNIVVQPYNIVVFIVNGNVFLLNKNSINIGTGQTSLSSADFITIAKLSKIGSSLMNVFKGYNPNNKTFEFYGLKSNGFSITKETTTIPTVGSELSTTVETGNILINPLNLQKLKIGNFTLSESDNFYTIFVNDVDGLGAEITVPNNLPDNFECNFIQVAKGRITFVEGDGTVLRYGAEETDVLKGESYRCKITRFMNMLDTDNDNEKIFYLTGDLMPLI